MPAIDIGEWSAQKNCVKGWWNIEAASFSCVGIESEKNGMPLK